MNPPLPRKGGSISAHRHDAKTSARADHIPGPEPARTRLPRNENYDWGQTAGGVKMFVKYFEEIAKLK